MAPTFFFLQYAIQERARGQPNHSQTGLWQPPTRLGDNERVDGLFELWYFNGTSAVILDPDTAARFIPHLVHYRTTSVYHDDYLSLFWAVPYDATTQAVGEGDADIWRRVGFEPSDEQSRTAPYASIISCGGNDFQLAHQRHGQTWCHTLLPRNHLKRVEDLFPKEQIGYGGLIGELTLIIALFAFSVRPRHVTQTLQYCMDNDAWHGPSIQANRIGKGWERTENSRRGMVVRIFYLPSSEGVDPSDELTEFEDGDLGKILN